MTIIVYKNNQGKTKASTYKKDGVERIDITAKRKAEGYTKAIQIVIPQEYYNTMVQWGRLWGHG